MAFDAIFQPLTFRNLTIKNRIIRSNISGRFDNYDGSGNQARINWEVKFAKGGVGAIVSSFVPVHLRGRIVPNYAMIDHDRHIPFWRALGEAVHAHDCKYILQLSHGGRQRDIQGIEYPRGLSSTDKPDPTHGFECDRMTTEQIRETVEAYAQGARRAREAGLDGVELHGANGYLITQFLSSAINDRKDEYGGALENRARFVLEIVRAIRKEVGDDFHLQMKISVQEHNDAVAFFGIGPSGNTAEESVQVCKWLEEAGVNALHVSTGSFFPHPRNPAGSDLPVEELALTYDAMISSGDAAFRTYQLFRNFPSVARRQWNESAPKPHEIEGANLADARLVKAAVGVPVICTGGFQTASVIAGAIQRGDCDMVSIARPLVANNDLVEVFRRGQDRADRPCTYCNKCLANVLEHPLGCYEESRYPSREAMLAEVMSVFQPQPFPAATEAAARGIESPEDLNRRINLFGTREWFEQPRLIGMRTLVQIRNELREKNLIDTEEPPLQKADVPATDPAIREARTADGTNNDLQYPKMGAVGCRFGRNVPLQHVFPDAANLMIPNPRVVSRELMTRDEFKPATILNLLAGAWIQFMVHDWFVHKRSTTDAFEVPTAAGDPWGAPSIKVPKSVPEPAPAGSTRPPAYANLNSHWWDSSQVYGSDRDMAAKLRTQMNGKLRIEPTGLLPVDPETGVHFSGFTDNWWIGLAMLHTLFTLEHNFICDLLAHHQPRWNDEQIYQKAKLINSALMAKIHTVEWTPAIVPHPLIKLAMNVNWSGLAGEDLQDALVFLNDKELLGGIVGSSADHHTAPYSLTEEFVSVYRMHPLMPDEFAFHSSVTGRLLEKRELSEIAGRKTPAIAERLTMTDLFYSFGTCHPGAVTLHNYPRHRPAPAWVAAFDAVITEAEVDELTAAVARSPMASLALVQLLRAGEALDVWGGLFAESTVYSMLQAGPEFARWLASRPDGRADPPVGPAVVTAREDAIVRVTLNRPTVHNAFDTMMRDELVTTLRTVVADPSVAELHLDGAGPSFCSGGDLDGFGTFPDPASAHGVRMTRSPAWWLAQCGDRTSVAVHGACIGAGIELAAFAREVIATADAFFQLPEVALGLVPGAGGTVSLPRRIGRQRTAWLALSGRRIDAATAQAWGLVDRVSGRPHRR